MNEPPVEPDDPVEPPLSGAERGPRLLRAFLAVSLDVRLFLGGIALVALYILDDAFLQPEAGPSRGGHLVSGTVPVAVLVVCAVAYPRLSVRLRAFLALGLGVTFVAAGIAVPVRHALAGQLAGDDFTGLLATIGGLVVAGVGVVALRRSRSERKGRSGLVERSLFGLNVLLVVFWIVLPVVLSFLGTHKGRAHTEVADLGRPYETVTFATSDGLKLSGWYVPSRNGAAVIAFPGRKGPVPHARMLARHGYGVLLFDRRGEGESEGDGNLLGWGGDRDLLAAAAYLDGRPDVRSGRVGGLGLSVGGELMLEAAARTTALRAVVSEGAGIRSVRELLDMPDAGKWIQLPFQATMTAATAVFANRLPPPNLKSLVAEIAPRPVLLIARPQGQGEELNTIYAAAGGATTTLWQIKEGGHTGGLSARPREYERRVVAFFDQALLAPG